MRRSRLCLLLAGCLWLARPCGVAAQDAPALDEAASAFASGSAAFEAERYAEALERFERAYELAPHDQVRFNIAVCLEELHRYREAAVEFEAVAGSHQLDPGTRDRARAAAEAARAQLATLALQSAEGALLDVQVDGVAACTTPCEVTTDPGAHVISYQDRHGAHERRVRVEAGGRLELVLASLPAVALGDPTPPVATPSGGGVSVGWAGAVGIGLFTAGTGGAIGFGIRAADVYASYEREGCAGAPCADGDLARDLTNASIGVMIGGALLLAIDLAFIDE